MSSLEHAFGAAGTVVGATAATAWRIATEPTQDVGSLGRAMEVAPSFVATILVIFVVMTFLKHLRARDLDREKRESAFDEMLIQLREETVVSVERMNDRNAAVLEKVANNLDRLAEGQVRLTEAIHACRRD